MARPKKTVPPPPPPTASRYHDIKSAATWFGGISRWTFLRLAHVLDIPSVYIGRRRFFREEDLAIAQRTLEQLHPHPWSLRAEADKNGYHN